MSGDLFLGGADLAATFLRHGLVDELRLYVHPVLIGTGTPLFPAAVAPTRLRLADTRAFAGGVVRLRYLLPGAVETAAGTMTCGADVAMPRGRRGHVRALS